MSFATEEVRRVTARDDLLTMAAAADEAVSIVGTQVALARRSKDDPSLFVIALSRYLRAAHEGLPSLRTQAWDNAAIIVRFGDMVGMRPACDYTPEQMHEFALADNASTDGLPLDANLPVGVFNRYHAARNLRLAGRFDDAYRMAAQPRTEIFGRGADPHLAHLLYEQGAALMAQGQAGQVADMLLEWETYWEQTRAAGHSTRYRFEYLQALSSWDSQEHDPQHTLAQLDTALTRLREGTRAPILSADGQWRESPDDHGVRELSIVLAKAELLASLIRTPQACAEAVTLGDEALRLANRVRGRMRVIARSRAPLAVAFRRLYGDIALLAARLSDAGAPGAGELGLAVALSAKQTGFAARIRADRDLMNPIVEEILEKIVVTENELDDPGFASTFEQLESRLKALHFELGDKVSAMLAETVLPRELDLADLRTVLGNRYALDYLELPHSAGEDLIRYRALIRPGRPVLFERFDPPAIVTNFFTARRQSRDLHGGISRDTRRWTSKRPARKPGWAQIAQVLPRPLLDELEEQRAQPIPLVISGHSWLSLVPWAALVVAGQDVRLVQRALITQTPVLSCLTFAGPPPVGGQALVRLVGADGGGVDVAEERLAWNLPAGAGDVPLSIADVRREQPPEPLRGQPRLSDVLTKDSTWEFLHIAAHGGPGPGEEAEGGYDGLRQVLQIPEQPLTAARALSLRWPASVLMASCHVGQVVNAKDAEPLNFVMALLTGGTRCVVAGIAAISDQETGRVARDMIRAVRAGGSPLDEALRAAQLEAIGRHADEAGWALLAAYVR